MLFLVISTPHPTRPSEVKELIKQYWPWAQDKLDRKLAVSFYARTGRGAVAIFDVPSNAELHRLINEWSDIIPAEFEIFPLVSPEEVQDFLNE